MHFSSPPRVLHDIWEECENMECWVYERMKIRCKASKQSNMVTKIPEKIPLTENADIKIIWGRKYCIKS
jgi:hypothetical protein